MIKIQQYGAKEYFVKCRKCGKKYSVDQETALVRGVRGLKWRRRFKFGDFIFHHILCDGCYQALQKDVQKAKTKIYEKYNILPDHIGF